MIRTLTQTATCHRQLARDEVDHRACFQAPDGAAAMLLIVNITVMGMMARGDMACDAGDRVLVDLPVVGSWPAEVRWVLGGRIGFSFPRPIDPSAYGGVLLAMRR